MKYAALKRYKKEKIDNQDYLNLKAAYAFDRRKFADKKILPGEGIVGRCALEMETKIIGVIELASFEEIPEFKVMFVEKVAESIASHIANIQINIKTNKLLEQTKSQAQELTEKEEEMRQNMEELKITQENMSVREEELLKEIEDLKDKLRNIEQ